MDFELTIPKVFEDFPSKKYINDCCIGGDEILNPLKDDIALEMNIDKSSIEIYQEDWGWALEFSKDKVTYFFAVSNASELEAVESLFTAYTQARRKEKKMFFNKTVDADVELKNFSEIVSRLSKKNGFEVN
jgi:hypothetical protein